MQCASFWRQYARSVFAALLVLAGTGAAYATDTYSPPNLSIPSVSVGAMTFTNMVVTVGSIVSGPSGSSGNGSSDTYNPATNQLTIPNVVVGSNTYHNVVITVGNLVSVASVSGADSYSPPNLSISSVQVGSLIYNNVTVTVGSILAVANGMPGAVRDNYSGGQLTIPAVQVGGHVYTNAVITVGSIVGVGGVAVPNVVGLTQAAAGTALAAAHLVVGTVTSATSATVPAGSVISQSPAAGVSAALGSAVNLVVSTGSGGGGGGIGTGVGWLPFIAEPVPNVTPTGQSGLFVLTPDPLAANENNIQWVIADNPVLSVGAAFVLKGVSVGSGFWPYAGFYAALDSNHFVEIYQVNLTNSSASVPTAVPIGNFVAKHVNALSKICESNSAQTNILDATSWFLVIHIGGSSGCGSTTATGDSWVVVTATATTTVNITTTEFDAFYNPSGLLTQMVLNDPATNNILLYADKSFTSPTTLFTGATTDDTIHNQQIAINSGFVGNGTVEFRELGKSSGSPAVYRLDYTGASSFKAIPSYNPGTDSLSSDSILTGTMADATNFYFTDTNYTGLTETVYQEPIGGAGSTPTAPIALYSTSALPGVSILGSNGSLVVLESVTFGNPGTSTLGTVPVGVAHTATLGALGPPTGFSGSIATTQMLHGANNDFSHSALFINLTCTGSSCAPKTHPDSTGILSVGNTTLQALLPTSQFLLEASILNSGNVLQIKGVTDTTTPTDGGGKLYSVPSVDNAGSYAGLVFEGCLNFNVGTCTQTGNFVIPANTLLPAVIGLSSAGNASGLSYTQSPNVFSGVVANVATQQIGIVSLSNTNIEFAF